MTTPVRDRLEHELIRAQRDVEYYSRLLRGFEGSGYHRYEPDMDRCG